MGLSIADIRDALAEKVGVALDASTLPVNAYGYPPDSPELNALLVMPRPGAEGGYVSYHRSFGGTTTGATGALCEISLWVELRCGGGQIDAARAMDLYLSAGNAESVVDAILADVTLGAAVESTAIGDATTPAWFGTQPGVREWLMAAIPLTIRARR